MYAADGSHYILLFTGCINLVLSCKTKTTKTYSDLQKKTQEFINEKLRHSLSLSQKDGEPSTKNTVNQEGQVAKTQPRSGHWSSCEHRSHMPESPRAEEKECLVPLMLWLRKQDSAYCQWRIPPNKKVLDADSHKTTHVHYKCPTQIYILLIVYPTWFLWS